MFSTVLYQIIIMLILMAVGFIAARTRLISEEGKNTLSNVLLMVVNPALVFISFQIDNSPKILMNLGMSFAASACTMALMIVLSAVIFRKNRTDDGNIEKFFTIYSNCGFIGIPLVNQMLGSEGVICLSGFVAVFNILVWTHGYVTISGSGSRKQLIKGILSPTMFAIAAGLICFLLNIRIPDLLYDSVDFIASMNTPLAMLIAGAALASASLSETLHNKRIYTVSAIRLLIYPAIVMTILHFIHLDPYVAYAVLVASACPAATTGVGFALTFKKNYPYASQIFVVTTVLSMLTIPAMVFIAETIGI